MKLSKGKYQTAMQVKGLSPEKYNIEEADSFHLLECGTNCDEKARSRMLLRGLRPWYGMEKKLQELGRPELLPEGRISANNPKKRGSGEGNSGVGLTHIRGVAWVMPCESKTHSKGSAAICRGKEKRGLYKEADKPCKRN